MGFACRLGDEASRFDTSGPQPEGPGFGRHVTRGHVRAERIFTWCDGDPACEVDVDAVDLLVEHDVMRAALGLARASARKASLLE